MGCTNYRKTGQPSSQLEIRKLTVELTFDVSMGQMGFVTAQLHGGRISLPSAMSKISRKSRKSF